MMLMLNSGTSTLTKSARAMRIGRAISARNLTKSFVARSCTDSALQKEQPNVFNQTNRRRRWFSSSSSSAVEGNKASSPGVDAHEELYETLYMWGTDKKGSLLKSKERIDETKIDVPTVVDWRTLLGYVQTTDVKIRKVVCGATDTAILLSNGTCYVCGENKQGQLGLGHTNPVPSTAPVRVELPPDMSTTEYIRDASIGPNFSAYVDGAGDLYTCGFGGSTLAGIGMLGHGNGATYLQPKLVESIVEDNVFVQQVQCGESHTTVLTTEGEVLTTGAGAYGILGNFDTIDQLYFEPVELLLSGITQISGGKSFTLALEGKTGVVYGWGRNHKGQLGTGLGLAVDMYAMQAVPEPIQADELLGRHVIHIATGTHHACCITKGGELFFWGSALYLEPQRINDLLHTQVIDVVCGQDYTIAVDKDHRAYSFGKGKNGCLGQGGSMKQANQATLMEVFVQDGVKVGSVSAGWDHAACLVKDE